MADVFVSYARGDRNFARKLAAALESVGLTVWWDRDIPAGAASDSAIERELDAARCVVVLWSATSTTSEWVKNEASAAVERGVLLPVLIEQVKLPLEFRRRQAVDLSRWDGNVSHEGFKQISDSISAFREGVVPSGTGSFPSNLPQPSRRNRLILIVTTVTVLAVAAILAIVYKQSAKLQPTPSSGISLTDATFTGQASYWLGKGPQVERASSFALMLRASGQKRPRALCRRDDRRRGYCSTESQGNGLVGDIVSDKIGGMCRLSGSLTSGGSGLEATYSCPDGEHGTLSLRRK